MDFFAALKRLGPKLVMIGEMVLIEEISLHLIRRCFLIRDQRSEVLHADVNGVHPGIRYFIP